MKYWNVLFLSGMLVTSTALADEAASVVAASDSDSSIGHAVGLSLGWVVANGMIYRGYFGTKSCWQGTFAANIDKAKKQEYADVSVSYERYLSTWEGNETFAPIAMKLVMGLEGEHELVSSYVSNKGTVYSDSDFVHTGIGIGIDLGRLRQKGLVLSLNMIYTASFRGFDNMEFEKLRLLPSASVLYNF